MFSFSFCNKLPLYFADFRIFTIILVNFGKIKNKINYLQDILSSAAKKLKPSKHAAVLCRILNYDRKDPIAEIMRMLVSVVLRRFRAGRCIHFADAGADDFR